MNQGREPNSWGGGTSPPSLAQRLRKAILKPPKPGEEGSGQGATAPSAPRSVEQIEETVRKIDDKERIIGLLAAPIAAAIALMVTAALIANDPPAHLKSGQVNPKHVSLTLYHDLTYVLLGLAVAILAAAWFRKRLFLGIVVALYGLALFNLRYWGFGVPFLLVGAWYLVRAFRAQRGLRDATGTSWGSGSSPRRSGRGPSGPKANKRYTPPSSSPKRRLPPASGPEKRVG